MSFSLKKVITVISFVTLIFLTGCKPMSNKNEVVYINIERVINESAAGTQALMHLDAVKKTLESGAAEAEKNYVGMTDKDAQQARTADAQLINNQWMAEQAGARGRVMDAIKKEVASLRAQKGYSIVIGGSQVIDVSKESDISDEVIKALEGKKIEFASLPVFTTINDKK
ncbi:TPA: OmpH family outer membrane protein [Morganella morganii]|nr:OmpH family outer membrane protein [Morganella morganii]